MGRAARREAGYRPNSIRIMRAVLRRAGGQAEREGLVSRNVATLSQPPRLNQPGGRALTVEQARTLLETARGYRLEAAYVLMLPYRAARFGGRRLSGVVALSSCPAGFA